MKEDGNIKLTFIGGYGRSGSTLIDLLLSQVNNIVVAGEIRHLFCRVMEDRELCNCGTELKKCKHWEGVLEDAFPAGYNQKDICNSVKSINTLFALPQLLWPILQTKKTKKSIRIYVDAYERVFSAMLNKSGDEVIIDSSKYPMHGLVLDRYSRKIEVATVLLVRDPRAVANSWENPKVRPEITWEKRLMPKHHALRSALAWNISNLLTNLLAKKDSRFMIQRYEDFIEHPKEVIERIAEFALTSKNVEVTDKIYDAVKIKKYHKIAGNPLGIKQKRIAIVPNDKWKRQLSGTKKFAVSSLCLRQMKKYGYRFFIT